MRKRRIGLHGIGPESMPLLALLAENPDLELLRFYDEDPTQALARIDTLHGELRSQIAAGLTRDWDRFTGQPALDVIIDDGHLGALRRRLENVDFGGPQVISLSTARLLYCHGVAPRDRKSELLSVLNEIVASVDLSVDGHELFARMLEIAVAVTHAEGGSLMLLGPDRRELFIQVAFGVEPELWPKIRVPLGEGIAGRVAEDARPLLLSGRADAEQFKILRERADLTSALCVPLLHEGKVLGVLNVHHSTGHDVFDDADLAFMEELAALDAEIIHRAQTHAALRAQAARYEAAREVHTVLAGPEPLSERLGTICRGLAERYGGGIATLYLPDDESNESRLSLAASSLPGGGAGAQFGVAPGQGLDGAAAQTRSPLMLRDDQGTLRYAAIPMMVRGHVEGVLALQLGTMTGASTEYEGSLIEVAQVLGEGVVHSRREARATAYALRVSAAHEAGLRMLSCRSAEDVARVATSTLAMLLGAEHVVLRLEEPETGRFRIASYFGAADDQAQPALFNLDKFSTIEAMRRRTALLIRDLPSHPKLGAYAGTLSSMLVIPLKMGGQVVGTMAAYDKVADDSFFTGRFNDDDLKVFSHFMADVERALAESGTPDAPELPQQKWSERRNQARPWRQRLQQELVRMDHRPGGLAVATCHIEADGESSGLDSERISRGMETVERALCAECRPFDVVARLSDRSFGILLPDPGDHPGDRIRRLARDVTDRIGLDEMLNEPNRLVLGFGFAVNEADEVDAGAMERRATPTRILIV